MVKRLPGSHKDLRTRAIATACQITEKDGLQALTARRVAAAVKCSVGTLYNLFDNLDDLIVQMNATTLEHLDQRCEDALAGVARPQRLYALADAYVEFAREQPYLYLALFEHRFPDSGRPPDWYREKVDRLLGRVEAELHAASATTNPSDEALAIWAGIHGIVSLEISDRFGGERMAKTLARLLVERFVSSSHDATGKANWGT